LKYLITFYCFQLIFSTLYT